MRWHSGGCYLLRKRTWIHMASAVGCAGKRPRSSDPRIVETVSSLWRTRNQDTKWTVLVQRDCMFTLPQMLVPNSVKSNCILKIGCMLRHSSKLEVVTLSKISSCCLLKPIVLWGLIVRGWIPAGTNVLVEKWFSGVPQTISSFVNGRCLYVLLDDDKNTNGHKWKIKKLRALKNVESYSTSHGTICIWSDLQEAIINLLIVVQLGPVYTELER